MKKLIITVSMLFLTMNASYSAAWMNDARTLFQTNRANIYVMNVRAFSAVDRNKNDIIEIEKGDTPGTFTGAIKKLDLLASVGVNTIHLLPITPVGKLKAMGTAGSLYAMDDFTKINPQLNDKTDSRTVEEEARYFIAQAHKSGIRVIVDMPSCGSYDMSLRKPNLFAKDESGNTIVPSDWEDVRLFKVKNANGTLNEELLHLYFAYIDMVKNLGVDGIRADVATIKPYEFWKQLISYARRDDKEFLFLAEASPVWTSSPVKGAEFTSYARLIEAGFDGYLGDFMDYPKFNDGKQLFSAYNEAKKLGEKFGAKKSVILNFATHDDISPVLINSNYSSQLLWLAATLPGNMYFVNGFMTDDFFIYKYANQKADKTYTDNSTYYVHRGKHDIFNFTRRPGGSNVKLMREYALASTLKAQFGLILEVTPNILKSSHKDIWAYEYKSDQGKIIVILNHNSAVEASGTIAYHGISKFDDLLAVKYPTGSINFEKNKFKVRLAPSDIAVFVETEQASKK